MKKYIICFLLTVFMLFACSCSNQSSPDQNLNDINDTSSFDDENLGISPEEQSDSSDQSKAEESSSDNNSMTEIEKETLLNNAEILTTQLIEYSISSKMIRDKELYGDLEIFRFLMCTFTMEKSPYYRFCNVSEDDIQYNLSDLQTIAYEVFGVENWFYEPDSSSYNKETQMFSINPAQGLRQDNFISDFNIEMTDNEHIKTECMVSCYTMGENGDPELSEIGLYRCTYKVINQNNNYFLRLESCGLCD